MFICIASHVVSSDDSNAMNVTITTNGHANVGTVLNYPDFHYLEMIVLVPV